MLDGQRSLSPGSMTSSGSATRSHLPPRPIRRVFVPIPLEAGEDSAGAGVEESCVYHPQGRPDWLLSYTISGFGEIRFPGGSRILAPGDLLLVRPDTTQDYGSHEGCGWQSLWAHFVPRPEVLAWLDLPRIGPGILVLALPPLSRPALLAKLREMQRFSRRGIGRSQELAQNALEAALLLADECNPRSTHTGHDPRIRDAIDHLVANLIEPPSTQAVADVCGLSRSHLTVLFKEQTGLTLGQFVEQHRLARARRLLEHTGSSLQEIADELGFSSPFYLSTRFKRAFGESPREYRRARARRRASTFTGLGSG